MADLIAIGYPDEATAEAAADEARQLAKDLIIEPDAIAVIVRDAKGDYHVHTIIHGGAGSDVGDCGVVEVMFCGVGMATAWLGARMGVS